MDRRSFIKRGAMAAVAVSVAPAVALTVAEDHGYWNVWDDDHKFPIEVVRCDKDGATLPEHLWELAGKGQLSYGYVSPEEHRQMMGSLDPYSGKMSRAMWLQKLGVAHDA